MLPGLTEATGHTQTGKAAYGSHDAESRDPAQTCPSKPRRELRRTLRGERTVPEGGPELGSPRTPKATRLEGKAAGERGLPLYTLVPLNFSSTPWFCPKPSLTHPGAGRAQRLGRP